MGGAPFEFKGADFDLDFAFDFDFAFSFWRRVPHPPVAPTPGRRCTDAPSVRQAVKRLSPTIAHLNAHQQKVYSVHNMLT
jgi:hypothetical protein